MICFCNCAAATAVKWLQSCPTLCDPIDGSPPVPVHVSFSFENRLRRGFRIGKGPWLHSPVGRFLQLFVLFLDNSIGLTVSIVKYHPLGGGRGLKSMQHPISKAHGSHKPHLPATTSLPPGFPPDSIKRKGFCPPSPMTFKKCPFDAPSEASKLEQDRVLSLL